MSKSGTPVLPESIARALSKACGGRPVYWTCVGTPGVSASQIVQDIHQIEIRQPGRLERLYREWKAKRRKWLERKQLRRRLTELEDTGGDNEVDAQNRNYLKDWWESLRKDPEQDPKHVRETTARLFREWWSQVSSRFRSTRERVKEDLTEIKEIVQNPTEDEEDHKDDLIHKGNVFRRDSLDPEIAAEYDIAVVLTGLNDLKDAFMPHMTKGRASSLKDGTDRIVGGLRTQLRSIVDALEKKMDLNFDKEPNTETESSHTANDGLQNLRRPLVVVPELPIAPLRLFHLVPLCWFLIPLFRAMENNKQFLSASFPEYVVFIPQPDLKWWLDVEAGLGPIRENIRSERLLLRTTDVTQNARERIQKLMQQFYYPDDDVNEESHRNQSSDGSQNPENRHRDEHHPHHPHHHSDHHIVPTDRDRGKGGTQHSNGSSYVAMDKMHPNDEGYELWGRHIAAAILEHWKR